VGSLDADDHVRVRGERVRRAADIELRRILFEVAHTAGGNVQPGQNAGRGPVDPLVPEVRKVLGTGGAGVDQRRHADTERMGVGCQ
jgi:hypothetical protein